MASFGRPKTQIWGLVSSPRVLWFSSQFSIYFRAAAALNFLSFAVCVKNARMPCDPQKTCFVHDFSMLTASPDACHASKKKANTEVENLTQNLATSPKSMNHWVAFSASGDEEFKESPTWPPGALPRRLPGSPGDLLAGPRRPKEAPRLAQEPPRPPPNSPEASRTPFWPPWGSMFDPFGG